jgi:hypothetical protein
MSDFPSPTPQAQPHQDLKTRHILTDWFWEPQAE